MQFADYTFAAQGTQKRVGPDIFYTAHQPRWDNVSGSGMHTQALVNGLFLLLVWAAVSYVVYAVPREAGYVYYFARYLYFVPILIAGQLLGRNFGMLVGFICATLFIPRFVDLYVTVGISPESVELGWLILLFILVPMLIISLAEFYNRHREMMRSVEQLGRVIEKSLDLRGLLLLVLKQSISLVNADAGEIFLSFKGHEDVEFIRAGNVEVQTASGARRTLLGWLMDSATRDGLVVLPNLGDDPRFTLPDEVAMARPSLLAVPLRQVGQTIGVLVLWRCGGRRFSREEVDLLRIVTDKTQMAVENAWLYSRTDEALFQQTNELALLLEASNEFATTLNPNTLLEKLCQRLIESAKGAFCYICLFDEDPAALSVVAGQRVETFDAIEEIGAEFSVDSLPLHRQVIREQQPLILIDDEFEAVPTEAERALLLVPDVKSVLMVPLVAKERCLGVAVLGERRSWDRNPFSKDRVELCSTLAQQATMALENINAFESIARQRQSMRLIIDNVTDGVFSTDMERCITEFNPAAEQLTGCSANEVVGRVCEEAFYDSTDDVCWLCRGACPIENVISGQDESDQVDRKEWIETPDGEKKFVNLTVAPQNDQQGSISGTVSVLRDVSREEELIRLKTEFISMVSHQLRTPLACIRSSADLLNTNGSDEYMTRDELLQMLDRQCSRLSRLVDQVLVASRIEHGEFQLTREPLALVPLVRSVVDLYRTQYSEYSFVVDETTSPAFALGDRLSVEVVLENLLENAVKYSPKGSDITVSLHNGSDDVVVSVSDQGVGISQDEIGDIFQQFHRLSGHVAGESEGFGLGLYIAKRLVVAQGGDIFVDSVPDHGTSFTFTLPSIGGPNGENTGH